MWIRIVRLPLCCLFSLLLLTACSENGESQKSLVEMFESKLVQEQGHSFQYACFISQANTAESRKTQHMAAVERLHMNIPSTHSISVMVNHPVFCEHEGRWSSLIYHAKDGSGWKVPTMYVRANEPFTWAVFTSDHPNTEEQISYTVQYQALHDDLKAAFIEDHGILSYSEALTKHIEAEIGAKTAFVSSGAWLDSYHRE